MSARSHVTITLGRSGQAVKRARPASDELNIPSSGGKQRVRDRLGSNRIDSGMHEVQPMNKRQRKEHRDSRLGDKTKNGELMESNRPLGRDDLRLKLRNQSTPRRDASSERKNDFDLRHRLKRNRHSSLRSHGKQVQESDFSGIERRLRPTRITDDLAPLDPSRKSYSSWTLESRRHRSPNRLISTSTVLSPPRGNTSRGLSPHRSSTIRGMSPLRHSAARGLSPIRYSTARGDTRGLSPIRYSAARGLSPFRRSAVRRLSPSGSTISRGLSPPRIYADLPHAPSMRSTPRHSSFITNGLIGDSRSVPMLSKPSVPVNVAKPVVRAPPPGAIAQRSLHLAEELTVSKLLDSLGLERYQILFQAEEVDMTALKQMGDNDLKDMGIPMGPRKKILSAVLSHTRQRHR